MGKKRKYFSNDWTSLRAEVSQLIASLNLSETDFRALSPYENWQQIEDKIREAFCSLSYPNSISPLWLNLKLESYVIRNFSKRPKNWLTELVFHQEKAWLLLSETVNEKEKLWCYEGKISVIQNIIENIGFFEIYIVSKKYEWMICINHHDNLIISGKEITDNLKKFESNFALLD